MNIIEIIDKKAKGEKLTQEEINFFIDGYTNNEIKDYQAAALVMAIKINGMQEDEVYYLTKAMVESGETLDLKDISNEIYDKHSTGGVGDKITIVLIPIMASLGYNVAKMSGRGLGYTGGTADKFASIPGFDMYISEEYFKESIKKIGVAIMTTSKNLVPADKKIYELRDTIACTESIPLIASSIMSKKIAAGANNIILDVTYGSGAFMKTKEMAEKLKDEMEKLGKNYGLNVQSAITNMDTPLGYNVGNSLEVKEGMDYLSGKENEEVEKVILELLKGLGIDKKKLREEIESGRPYLKFKELVSNQGGNLDEFMKKFDKQNNEENSYPVYSKSSGKVKKLSAIGIAKSAFILGSGRKEKEDEIDYFSGVRLLKKEGDEVLENEKIAEIYIGNYMKEKLGNDEGKIKELIEESKRLIYSAYEIL